MDHEIVRFKGAKEGLQIILDPQADFERITNRLEQKLKLAQGFFTRGNITASVSGRELNPKEYDKIKEILETKFSIPLKNTSLEGETKEDNRPVDIDKDDKESMVNPETFYLSSHLGLESETLFIRKTIRSGQNIQFPGNVVLIGDINPGAMVSAVGSVVVLGAVRGVVHAGIKGKKEAFIAAARLQPTLIRIADILCKAPEDGDLEPPGFPEIARIIDERIYIEPYI